MEWFSAFPGANPVILSTTLRHPERSRRISPITTGLFMKARFLDKLGMTVGWLGMTGVEKGENEMPKIADTNAELIAEFRASNGEVAAPYDDPPPMLLLHTIGAKSGKEHVVPMRCLPDGESLYIFGSAHGSDRNPDWHYNLVAHPDITIEKGVETIPVLATEVSGEERETVFARQSAKFPIFAEYQRKLSRTIPVIRLDRRTV